MKRTELKRSPMVRKPSKLKRTPLGHASPAQKAKVAAQGCRIPDPEGYVASADGSLPVDPAHITPRTAGGCDHPDCVVGLYRGFHRLYDEGNLDLLPYLTLEEQAHAVSHLGILGALKRTTGDNYVPEKPASSVGRAGGGLVEL
jgi:hypothetical protein